MDIEPVREGVTRPASTLRQAAASPPPPPTTAPSEPPGSTGPPLWRTAGILVICVAQFLVSLDLSIANVAIPDIRSDLGLTSTGAAWVLSGYSVAFAALLLLAGRVADLAGRRRVFVIGLLVFTVASALAGTAWSTAALIVGRVLQGAGAALIAPAALGLLTAIIPEGPQRRQALGLYGAILSAGFVSGMLAGGVLTDTLGWRATMYVNIPITLTTALLAHRCLPESRVSHRAAFDVPGAVLSALAMAALVYALSQVHTADQQPASFLTALIIGLVAAVGFVLVERRSRSPLVPPRLLGIATIARANLLGLILVASYSGMLFVLTLYLQEGLGHSPLATGLIFAVSGAVAVPVSLTAGRLVTRWGPRRPLVTGVAIETVALLPLVMLPARGGVPLVIAATTVNAVGHIVALVVVSIAATDYVPADHKASAGALLNTSQQLGVALGVALVATVSAVLADQTTTTTPSLIGWRAALATTAALAAVGLLIARRLDTATGWRGAH